MITRLANITKNNVMTMLDGTVYRHISTVFMVAVDVTSVNLDLRDE